MRAGLISGKARPARPRLSPDDQTRVFTASPSDATLTTPPSTIVVRANAFGHTTSSFTASSSDATLATPPSSVEVLVSASVNSAHGTLHIARCRRFPG